MLLTMTAKSVSHCEVRSYIEGTCKQEALLCNHFCRGNEISITYSERMFVAPATKHEKLMRCIILSSVACQTLQHFSTSSHKQHDFQGVRWGVILHKICALIVCTALSEMCLILRRIQRDIIMNVYMSSRKISFLLVRYFFEIF
jgi:hypothetical protein